MLIRPHKDRACVADAADRLPRSIRIDEVARVGNRVNIDRYTERRTRLLRSTTPRRTRRAHE